MAARIVLTSPTTELALAVVDDHLPQAVHWGDPLGDVQPETFDAMGRTIRGATNGAPHEGYHVAVIPEEWTGWQGHPGISGSRRGEAWAPQFTVTAVTVDGRAVGDDVVRGREAVIDAVDDVAGLGLRLRFEMFDTGLVRSKAALTNTGADGYQLDQLLVALPLPTRATELLDFFGRHNKERVPQRSTLGVGAHWREGRHGRTGADSAYVLHAGTPGFSFGEGELWTVHTAWSGNHIHYAEGVITGESVIGGGELLLPGEVVLARDETYESPWLFFNHGHGLDAIAQHHHAFLRASHPVSVDRPVTLNTWEAVYFDHRIEPLLELAEKAAQVGVERFVLDDGWFGSRRDDHRGLGDWVVSGDAWPEGLGTLFNRVRELGMQVGLWFEPEMINEDSDVFRAHPEWVLKVPGRWPLPQRNQWVLDLTNPEAYAHVRDQMVVLLDEYGIDYIKWDYNRDIADGGSQPLGRPAVHEQTKAFYRLVDELKAHRPGLEIESCSSGGARIDLEVMQHCDRVWVSDNIDPTDRQQMLRWTTQLLPPEVMGSHIASGHSHVTGRAHSLTYRASTAVFGHLGIEWDLRQCSPEDLAELGRWVEWYKAHRGLLLGGQLVRVDHPGHTFLHGVTDGIRGIYSYVQIEMSGVWSYGNLLLPGLAPERTYRVAEIDLTAAPYGQVRDGDRSGVIQPVVMTGRQLAVAGVPVGYLGPEQGHILVAEPV